MTPVFLLARLRSFLFAPPQSQLVRIEARLRDMHFAHLAELERYADPRCLIRHGYRCFSQNQEDGILDEIFRRIGTTNRTFIEFGVGAGIENNTIALAFSGWSGLWIEADEDAHRKIRRHFAEALEKGHLTVLSRRVTAENVEALFESTGISSDPDLLSIDIDGNDYWIWKAIRRFRPRVVVVEYNASLGRTSRSVMPYRAERRWDGSACFGASLGALEDLGREKGYALVGCDLAGVNAFFVRADCLGERFLAPYTADHHYEPPRYGATGAGHPARWAQYEQVSGDRAFTLVQEAAPAPSRTRSPMGPGAVAAKEADPAAGSRR